MAPPRSVPLMHRDPERPRAHFSGTDVEIYMRSMGPLPDRHRRGDLFVRENHAPACRAQRCAVYEETLGATSVCRAPSIQQARAPSRSAICVFEVVGTSPSRGTAFAIDRYTVVWC